MACARRRKSGDEPERVGALGAERAGRVDSAADGHVLAILLDEEGVAKGGLQPRPEGVWQLQLRALGHLCGVGERGARTCATRADLTYAHVKVEHV